MKRDKVSLLRRRKSALAIRERNLAHHNQRLSNGKLEDKAKEEVTRKAEVAAKEVTTLKQKIGHGHV